MHDCVRQFDHSADCLVRTDGQPDLRGSGHNLTALHIVTADHMFRNATSLLGQINHVFLDQTYSPLLIRALTSLSAAWPGGKFLLAWWI